MREVIRGSPFIWILLIFYVTHLTTARLHLEEFWKHDDKNGVGEPNKLSPVIFSK